MQNFFEEEECLSLKKVSENKLCLKEGSQVESIDLKIDGQSDLMRQEFITDRKKYYLLFFIQGILNELPYEITLVASQDLVSQFHKENMISVVP